MKPAVLYCVQGLSSQMRGELIALARDAAQSHGFWFDQALVAPSTHSSSLESALEYVDLHDTGCVVVPTLKHLPQQDVAPVLRRCDLITLYPLASWTKFPRKRSGPSLAG
ncbi:hypothetical protein [Nocardia brasiliensis]|uniref:hypothetical protein n=1 Tax=Nocardia brasiliensis TaxID=37326 RepID=UPI002453FEA5|nr:hypothetical protein [Nocardia brasiliensis]